MRTELPVGFSLILWNDTSPYFYIGSKRFRKRSPFIDSWYVLFFSVGGISSLQNKMPVSLVGRGQTILTLFKLSLKIVQF